MSEEMQEIEAIARKGLKGEETLLSHCSMLSGGKAAAGIFIMLGGLVCIPFSIALFFDAEAPLIVSILIGGLALFLMYSGIAIIKASKQKYCFVTDERLCLLDKRGNILVEIRKENIQRVEFIPKGTMMGSGKNRGRSMFSVVLLWVNGRKKYRFNPLFNDEEIARAIDEISKPYQKN